MIILTILNKIWNEALPGSIDSGRVTIQEHDFLKPQPVKDADLFFLRAITHDWGSSYVVKILRHLRDAAVVGKTRLLIIDQVAKYACKDDSATTGIHMPVISSGPDFLLANVCILPSPGPVLQTQRQFSSDVQAALPT